MPLEYRPNFEKIVELMLYLASTKPGLDKYQVVKLFYLADREHLTRYGRPITLERYVALRFGPVASNAMDLMEGDKYTLRQAGLDKLPFETETVATGDGKALTYLRKPLREVDFDLFSKSDIEVVDEIVAKYGDCTFQQLFDITHDHYAYKRAWGQRPAGTSANDMRYEDMIEDPKLREKILEDFGPVASFME